MLVDNPLLHPSYFAAAPAQSSSDYSDFSDIFDTDLFNTSFEVSNSTSPASQGSSPKNLLTPPQEALPTSFPEVYEDLFQYDDASADFMSVNVFDTSYGAPSGGGVNYNIGYDVSNMGMNIPPIDDPIQMSIDPQLVDTPSAATDDPEEEQEQPSFDVVQRPEQEKLTFTIAPVKVGGFGKARKGTIQSGGVVKKSPNAYLNKDKENPSNTAIPSSKKPAPLKAKQTPTSLPSTAPVSGLFLTNDKSSYGGSEGGDGDDDDLPQDWRPPPEVLAKMTSKEKRQLRNKISARNFRVRRKEYITTLEGDIAERDRLLDHFRTVLGSQESENVALRQEVAALKKALLGGPINLPPPAPLPEQSAAETLAASNTNTNTATVQSSPLLTANTQKDLPSSPRIGGPRFWGGVGLGGGVTPVHTTIVPDISTIVRNGLQENINPSLNAMRNISAGNGIGPNKTLGGFDGFADLNPFTMKTLDAYRMHLWGKMAAQQQIHQQNQSSQNHHQTPSRLASELRPQFFSASPKPNLPPLSGYGSTLSALLSGKHNVPYSSSSAYPTPPTSPLLPLLLPKGAISASSQSSPNSSSQLSLSSQKEQQHAMLAAMASQTLFRKLGSAVWDAFIGSSSSSSRGDWDADKVRKVLEGKAVLRVVDVEPATVSTTAAASSASVSSTHSTSTSKWTGVASRSSLGQSRPTVASTSSGSSNLPHAAEDSSSKMCSSCKAAVCDILEESMRGLSLGKKM